MISSANSMMLGYSKNWSTIGLSFRRRYPDFLRLFYSLGYIFQSDRCLVFRILNYRSSLLCSVSSGFPLSSVFWLILEKAIKDAVQREFYYKAMISNQYYLASFKDLYGRKYRGCLYSDYCSVDLRALPAVIHILIGIIPPLSSLCSIYPLSKLRGRNFL